LGWFCNEQALGISREDSAISHFFEPYYTQAQLAEERLWERLEEKVNSFGGCAGIP